MFGNGIYIWRIWHDNFNGGCGCSRIRQQTTDWASFSLLIFMMVGKIYNIWYSSCSGLLHMELYRYASNFLFLSEAWKSIRTGSPWEVHTKSPSCDQINTGGLWASWSILATWTQDLVNVSYGFRKVHTGPCGRTGLETSTWSICGAVRSPQAACMRPVRFRTRSIGSSRQIRSAV